MEHLSNDHKDHPNQHENSHKLCDEWPLSLALWRKFYNSHGKYKPGLKEYFHMCQCQLNFTVFCHKCTWYFLATSHPSERTCARCL